MDIYKLKFTVLQQEILRFLFVRAGRTFTARALAKHLAVSPTAIAKSLPALEADELITVHRDAESRRLSIGLNREERKVFALKRVENLRMLTESGLVDHLTAQLPGATIIVFGSYAFGEDTVDSDIDIAIIGGKRKEIDLQRFEKLLERNISLHLFAALRGLPENLKANVLSGIVLEGAIRL